MEGQAVFGLCFVFYASMPKITDQDLICAIDAGVSISDISTKYGISTVTLTKYIKRLNLSDKVRANSIAARASNAKSSIDDRILELIKQNKVKRQIADELGVSLATISRRLYDLGIKLDQGYVNNNTEYKKKQAEVHSSMEYKEKQKESQAAAWTDTKKEEHSKIVKLTWSREEYRARQIATWSDKKLRARQKAKQCIIWLNEQYKDRMAIVRSKTPKSLTKPHIKVCEILKSLNIEHIIEHPIGPWNFDIFIPEHKMLVEVQGDYWHSLPKALRNDKAKSTYINQYFPEYKLKYVLEHECLQQDKILAKIKYWLGLDTIGLIDFNFRLVEIKQVDRTLVDPFLYNWHYQHHGRHGIDVGGFLNEELICVARFTSPHRNEIATSIGYSPKEVLELSRLCVHPKYQKKNLLSWFLARCEKLLPALKPKIKCLVSFADATFNHTGAVYKASNWKLNATVPPNYNYIDTDGWVMHKKTLWNHAKKMMMSEREFAEKYGYTKAWGKEKYKFIKVLGD